MFSLCSKRNTTAGSFDKGTYVKNRVDVQVGEGDDVGVGDDGAGGDAG